MTKFVLYGITPDGRRIRLDEEKLRGRTRYHIPEFEGIVAVESLMNTDKHLSRRRAMVKSEPIIDWVKRRIVQSEFGVLNAREIWEAWEKEYPGAYHLQPFSIKLRAALASIGIIGDKEHEGLVYYGCELTPSES
jgi:hypothetical protein